MASGQKTSAKEEQQHHSYTGNVIPWYVRLIWLLFWIFAIYYAIRYFLPAVQADLLQAP